MCSLNLRQTQITSLSLCFTDTSRTARSLCTNIFFPIRDVTSQQTRGSVYASTRRWYECWSACSLLIRRNINDSNLNRNNLKFRPKRINCVSVFSAVRFFLSSKNGSCVSKNKIEFIQTNDTKNIMEIVVKMNLKFTKYRYHWCDKATKEIRFCSHFNLKTKHPNEIIYSNEISQ